MTETGLDYSNEAARRVFIHAELATGTVLAVLARAAFKSGSSARGDSTLVKADRALQEARKWIDKANALGIDVEAERRESLAVTQLFLEVQKQRP
jgi:hypothetical protein